MSGDLRGPARTAAGPASWTMSDPASAAGASSVRRGVPAAIEAVAAGRPVVVLDDADRENEGDLIFAAGRATPELVAFTVRHTSGFLCVALPEADCARLGMGPMHVGGTDRYGTAYQVTVDLVGTGTGISARSRAATVAALADPATRATDLTRPGHVVPLRARAGGVLARAGHTEAAVDLARLAGEAPVGALCEIVSVDRPGEMARGAELERFAAEHGLVLVTVAEIAAHRRRTEPRLRRVATTSLPTRHGLFTAVGYLDELDGAEHLALVAGDPAAVATAEPFVHVECLSGDVLGSTACECRRALDHAMARCSAVGGLVVYLRPAANVRACGLHGSVADAAVAAAVVEEIQADLGADPVGTQWRPSAAATVAPLMAG